VNQNAYNRSFSGNLKQSNRTKTYVEIETDLLKVATTEQMRVCFLRRLRRLLRLRREHATELNDKGLELLDKSIFAAYCDCLDIGQGEEAALILKNPNLPLEFIKR
jgi:hypothetical protein